MCEPQAVPPQLSSDLRHVATKVADSKKNEEAAALVAATKSADAGLRHEAEENNSSGDIAVIAVGEPKVPQLPSIVPPMVPSIVLPMVPSIVPPMVLLRYSYGTLYRTTYYTFSRTSYGTLPRTSYAILYRTSKKYPAL